MKLIFTFSIPREFYRFYLSITQSRYGVPYIETVTTSLELPDQALDIANAKDHVLTIAKAVGDLTQANLSITCTTFRIKDLVIKDISSSSLGEMEQREIAGLFSSYIETIVLFNYRPHDTVTRQLRIAAPIPSLLPKIPPKLKLTKRGKLTEDKRPCSFKESLRRPKMDQLSQYDQARQAYYARFVPLVDSAIPLLNTNPHLNDWVLLGVHPDWYNEVQHKQAVKRIKQADRKAQQEMAKKAKLEAKRKDQAEKMEL